MNHGSQQPGWQRYVPKAVPLIQTGASASGKTAKSIFRVPTPDSRLRVKVSLVFVRTVVSGTTPIATIWLAETDDEDAGFSGDQIPLTNIEGTFLAPTAIPADVGLLGYSREFFTAADYIQGQLIATNNGVQGYWVLQTRYQPQVVGLADSEWNLIIAQCNPNAPMIQLP